MEFQLVIQFRGDALRDYDEMIALENELIEKVGDSANVDGHDMGSGQRNIFILTSDPVRTFSRVAPLLKRIQDAQCVTVAYRLTNGQDYIVLWPERSKEKFKIT